MENTTRLAALPTLDPGSVPLWRWVRHAVALTLGFLALLAAIAIIAALVLPIRETVAGDGAIEPVAVTSVRATETGFISKVLVKSGDSVRAGAVIAQLDAEVANATVQDLEAQIAEAKVDVARLEQALPIDRQRAATDSITAEAHVARARAQMRQRMLDYGVDGDPDSVARAAGARVHITLDAASADLLAAHAEVANAQLASRSSDLSAHDIQRKRL